MGKIVKQRRERATRQLDVVAGLIVSEIVGRDAGDVAPFGIHEPQLARGDVRSLHAWQEVHALDNIDRRAAHMRS
jgi:hypothetical protein